MGNGLRIERSGRYLVVLEMVVVGEIDMCGGPFVWIESIMQRTRRVLE
jgi:hypothetical protein